MFDILSVVVTGLIAWHGLTFRDETGELETGHLVFGSIALFWCVWFLLKDVLGVV